MQNRIAFGWFAKRRKVTKYAVLLHPFRRVLEGSIGTPTKATYNLLVQRKKLIMLPKAEWEYLVRYYKMAKDDVDGLIYFQNSYSVSEEEAAARRRLLERGLIEIHKSENISLDLCELFNLPYLKITHEGEDVARQYSSRFKRFGLLCAAQEHRWLWYIITFIVGVAATIFVQWFCSKFF